MLGLFLPLLGGQIAALKKVYSIRNVVERHFLFLLHVVGVATDFGLDLRHFLTEHLAFVFVILLVY